MTSFRCICFLFWGSHWKTKKKKENCQFSVKGKYSQPLYRLSTETAKHTVTVCPIEVMYHINDIKTCTLYNLIMKWLLNPDIFGLLWKALRLPHFMWESFRKIPFHCMWSVQCFWSLTHIKNVKVRLFFTLAVLILTLLFPQICVAATHWTLTKNKIKNLHETQ